MKIAFLCLCHDNFEYVKSLATFCKQNGHEIFIHVDRASINNDEELYLKELPGSLILGEERIKNRWGTISLVKSTLNLLKESKKYNFDKYLLISGSDCPIVSMKEIEDKLNLKKDFISVWNEIKREDKNNNLHNSIFKYHNYNSNLTNVGEVQYKAHYRIHLARLINKILSLKPIKKSFSFHNYYKGSQWWCLSHDTVEKILSLDHDFFMKEFSTMHAPDELYFQTLYFNLIKKSKPKIVDKCNTNLHAVHYIDWNSSSKKKGMQFVDVESIEKMRLEGAIFARKIDASKVESYMKLIKELMRN
ncbi:beta-1,6-N-acetylglucosaminyltransferase [uncultured Vibrio sp.]|uniref:beta-1,6-N-acetylglucosaminyltransferase n=1 Tax=uncultured Vibrio sp. TaxID=114054 RepID=UPI002AA87BF0|nr:beta-1,6-N-acetylglucosaminyltransferase [uncultured Vibrio sp.]